MARVADAIPVPAGCRIFVDRTADVCVALGQESVRTFRLPGPSGEPPN